MDIFQPYPGDIELTGAVATPGRLRSISEPDDIRRLCLPDPGRFSLSYLNNIIIINLKRVDAGIGRGKLLLTVVRNGISMTPYSRITVNG